MTNNTEISSQFSAHLDRLERLTRTLLAGRYRHAEKLWQMQVELLELQQAVQADIGAAKINPLENEASLDLLRWTRHQARRLGDTFAWLFLQNNRRNLLPLSKNSPVPVSQSGPSTEAALRLARDMWMEGWGFPVLHDVTNILRVGDVTFVNYDHGVTHTVEVKSRQTSEVDSHGVANFEVTAHFAHPPAFTSEKLVRSRSYPRRKPARLEKQLRRIQEAVEHQTARHAKISEISSGPLLTVDLSEQRDSNWSALIAVCRAARRNGFAARVVDGVACYAAYYSESGVDAVEIASSELSAQIVNSGMLACDTADSSLLVLAVPTHYSNSTAERNLPYYLYPIPRASVVDLMRGRMVIAVIVNIGKIVDAYRRAGLTVDQKHSSSGDEITVSKLIEVADGTQLKVEYHHLEHDYAESFLECRPLSYLVSAAIQALEAVELNLQNGDLRSPANPSS